MQERSACPTRPKSFMPPRRDPSTKNGQTLTSLAINVRRITEPLNLLDRANDYSQGGEYQFVRTIPKVPSRQT